MNGWEWRIADPISLIGSDRFHAYDGRDLSACQPAFGLMASVAVADEGSNLCPRCMTVVQAGRPPGGDATRTELVPAVFA